MSIKGSSNFSLSLSLFHVQTWEEKPQSGRLSRTDSPRGRGSLRFKSPEACLGAGNPERERAAKNPSRGAAPPRRGGGGRDPTAGMSRGPPTRWSSVPPPSTRSGNPEGLPTLPNFQLKSSPKLRVPQLRTLACNVAASGTPSYPQGHPDSSIPFPGRAGCRVPQPPASPLRVRGGSPPLRGQAQPQPCTASSPGAPDTARRQGGGRANGGTAPNRLPARRAGGLLGLLHLLFLKRRGADGRHHSSPGPGHRHTLCPAFGRRSGGGGGGNSGGRAPER